VIYFLDTSVLMKRYFDEPGSAAVLDIALARIAEAEAGAVICQAHHRAEISERVRDRALVQRWPLRGYDAVQLACAAKLRTEAGAVDLWCTDGDLVNAARGEGLLTMVL